MSQIDLAIIERRLIAPAKHNALEYLLELRKVDPRTHGVSSVEVALTGTNLLDERIRNHVSFRKNEVLAPGRGARLSATARF